MPSLELTDEQVIALVKQLPPAQQGQLLKWLIARQWGAWEELSNYGADRARQAAAQRGRNWDAMTENERETFIDELIHEDRACGG